MIVLFILSAIVGNLGFSLFLDFLAGNQSYECTMWSNPTRN